MAHRDAVPAEHRPMLQVLRTAPRPVWVLIAGTFVNRVGSYFSTFVVLFLTERGFSASSLPLVLAAIGVGAMAGSLAGGWLADTIGRKRSLVTSMTASALALMALALVSGQLAIVAAVCVVAICTQSYIPAAAALLVDHSAPADRVPLFALFRVALNVGAALGPLFAALVASSSYDLLFLIDSATCMLFAGLLLGGLPAERSRRRPRGARGLRGLRGLRVKPFAGRPRGGERAPGVALLCVAIAGVTMVYAQHTSSLPLDLTAGGMTIGFYALLLTCNGLLVVIGELPLASLTRRAQPHRPMVAGALMMGVGMALCGLLPGAVAILAAVALWSLGEMVLTPVANSAMAALSRPDRIARDQGRLAAAQTLGFVTGPIVGVLAYGWNPLLPWLGCLAIGAGSAATIWMAHQLAHRSRAEPVDELPAAPAAANVTPTVAHA
jgi:predicted MFS family arabinose efflux permease